MSGTLILLLIVALVAVVAALGVARSRRANDGVDSFRRQIDALSHEARRPVVDQVQNAAGRQPGDDDADHRDDDRDDDGDDGVADEDGARGT